ncbi:tetrapyrrole-binding protein chloroplastic [Phtheirospermum japonicum]|uniref:Tetrapyrrole-binding protein chloroplastic n=1 Tax=Phtheirospermum japonicum TaxID=374723 RepID=A0A830B877_9LAMI|nr:tetrapyrrole-binding protein chloroplastic [Phtheirospermum japonicum]
MATNTFNSIHHNHSLRRRRHPVDSPPTTATTKNYPFYLKTNRRRRHPFPLPIFRRHPTTNPSTTPQTVNDKDDVSFELLKHHLSAQNFRQADEETRRLLISLAGEAAVKRGYVFFSEVQFIPKEDLKAIDALWRQHSDDKYGYSVQKRIWKKVGGDFTKFFIRVGWMKKLESCEVDQYNYRSFPGEFIWELEEGTPEGHLPLTNALRGTQLLTSILNHPAFDQGDDDDDDIGQEDRQSGVNIKPLMGNASFKPNYTF